ncbi:RNA polymerase sigma factor [Anaerovorax odorimutans]|uniref:RNA polymerase sigma factor n=1 Tax=Anaerovorax odorimutans TaxID=109327 RepID=UPI00042812E4|nr:sigma-70 family RNA polymerase sigma factor [Anaerovorax odorimutans]
MDVQYDESFFIENIAKYHESIYRFIYSIVYDNHLAEDLTQDTMEKAWEKMQQLKDPKKAKGWLFTIARREVAMYYRKHRLKREYKENRELLIDDVEDIEVNIINVLEELEQNKMVLRILELLDEKYRRIIKMHYLDELSLKEIGEILNINYNTVRTNCSRGLIKIRELYDRQQKKRLY